MKHDLTLTRIERNVVQSFQSLDEEPTRSAVPGSLPSVDSLGQASPAFQDVDENLTNAENQILEGLESQFAHMNTPDANRHERRLDGHVIIEESLLDPSTDQQSSRLPANMDHGDAAAFIRVALQVAVAGLKAAPIPDLDRIPRALLLLIETYEVSDPAILPGVLSGSID